MQTDLRQSFLFTFLLWIIVADLSLCLKCDRISNSALRFSLVRVCVLLVVRMRVCVCFVQLCVYEIKIDLVFTCLACKVEKMSTLLWKIEKLSRELKHTPSFEPFDLGPHRRLLEKIWFYRNESAVKQSDGVSTRRLLDA